MRKMYAALLMDSAKIVEVYDGIAKPFTSKNGFLLQIESRKINQDIITILNFFHGKEKLFCRVSFSNNPFYVNTFTVKIFDNRVNTFERDVEIFNLYGRMIAEHEAKYGFRFSRYTDLQKQTPSQSEIEWILKALQAEFPNFARLLSIKYEELFRVRSVLQPLNSFQLVRN